MTTRCNYRRISDDIEYTIVHTRFPHPHTRFRHPALLVPTDSCTLMVVDIANTSPFEITCIDCFDYRGSFCGYYIDHLEKVKDHIRSSFPSIQDSCAEAIANTLHRILREANDPSWLTTAFHNVEICAQPLTMVDPRESTDGASEGGARARPATEASVRELLNKRCSSVAGNQCVICMEEMEARTSAVRMPCSHSFHKPCLVEWLNNSHVCPLCRYEMPTED